MVKLRSGTLKKTDATRIAGKVNQNFSLTKKNPWQTDGAFFSTVQSSKSCLLSIKFSIKAYKPLNKTDTV